jgi:predicted nucleic-acid-binding protein
LTKHRLVDTNLIVRYFVQDHEKHARAAGKLFDACDRGELVIVVLPVVLAECVFVLESFYRPSRADIASALGRLISSPGVEIGEVTVHLDALNRYKRTKAHFVDCVIAAIAVAKRTYQLPRLIRTFESLATCAWKQHSGGRVPRPSRFCLGGIGLLRTSLGQRLDAAAQVPRPAFGRLLSTKKNSEVVARPAISHCPAAAATAPPVTESCPGSAPC